MGVNDQVVRIVDLESLAPDYCGYEARARFSILSCEEAIQLAYGALIYSGARSCLK